MPTRRKLPKISFPAEINSEILFYLDPVISRLLRYDFTHMKILSTAERPKLWKKASDKKVRKYVIKNSVSGYDESTVEKACENGWLDIIVHISLKESKTYNRIFDDAMNVAAKNGHIEIVRYLHENRREGCTTTAMDWAAKNGHLDVVRYLHENRSEGCTTNAMDWAAGYGYLDVVRFLHENRNEGCTMKAMKNAATFGYLDVVRWLHEYRNEGCTRHAMSLAAWEGQMDIVRFLHESRSEECTKDAMKWAAENNHLDMLIFLDENGGEGQGQSFVFQMNCFVEKRCTKEMKF